MGDQTLQRPPLYCTFQFFFWASNLEFRLQAMFWEISPPTSKLLKLGRSKTENQRTTDLTELPGLGFGAVSGFGRWKRRAVQNLNDITPVSIVTKLKIEHRASRNASRFAFSRVHFGPRNSTTTLCRLEAGGIRQIRLTILIVVHP